MTVRNLQATRDRFVETSVVVNPEAPLKDQRLLITREWFREQRIKCTGCRYKGWLTPYSIQNPSEPKVWKPVTESCPRCGAPGEDASVYTNEGSTGTVEMTFPARPGSKVEAKEKGRAATVTFPEEGESDDRS